MLLLLSLPAYACAQFNEGYFWQQAAKGYVANINEQLNSYLNQARNQYKDWINDACRQHMSNANAKKNNPVAYKFSINGKSMLLYFDSDTEARRFKNSLEANNKHIAEIDKYRSMVDSYLSSNGVSKSAFSSFYRTIDACKKEFIVKASYSTVQNRFYTGNKANSDKKQQVNKKKVDLRVFNRDSPSYDASYDNNIRQFQRKENSKLSKTLSRRKFTQKENIAVNMPEGQPNTAVAKPKARMVLKPVVLEKKPKVKGYLDLSSVPITQNSVFFSDDLAYKETDFSGARYRSKPVWTTMLKNMKRERVEMNLAMLMLYNNGAMPVFIGKNTSNAYIFESATGDKVFRISEDGTTFVCATYNKAKETGGLEGRFSSGLLGTSISKDKLEVEGDLPIDGFKVKVERENSDGSLSANLVYEKDLEPFKKEAVQDPGNDKPSETDKIKAELRLMGYKDTESVTVQINKTLFDNHSIGIRGGGEAGVDLEVKAGTEDTGLTNSPVAISDAAGVYVRRNREGEVKVYEIRGDLKVVTSLSLQAIAKRSPVKAKLAFSPRYKTINAGEILESYLRDENQ